MTFRVSKLELFNDVRCSQRELFIHRDVVKQDARARSDSGKEAKGKIKNVSFVLDWSNPFIIAYYIHICMSIKERDRD